MSKEFDQAKHVDLAADIVSAYVAKNAVQVAELPSLIASVHSALRQAARGYGTVAGGTNPAVPSRSRSHPTTSFVSKMVRIQKLEETFTHSFQS